MKSTPNVNMRLRDVLKSEVQNIMARQVHEIMARGLPSDRSDPTISRISVRFVPNNGTKRNKSRDTARYN